MGALSGWNSPNTVERINSFFEYLETISLAVAIALELLGMRISSDVAWVMLVISDIGRQLYGRRDKVLSEARAKKSELKLAKLESFTLRRTKQRSLNKSEETFFTAQLASYAGQGFGITISAPTAPATPNSQIREQITFVGQLQGLLLSAGWVEQELNFTAPDVPEGVTLFVSPSANSSAAWHLSLLLETAQIACAPAFVNLPIPLTIVVGKL